MKKLSIVEKLTIYLKHEELVNESFRSNSRNTKESYEINGELFFFHPKSGSFNAADDASTVEQKVTIETKKRKRKKSNTLDTPNDIKVLNTEITKTLQVLKESEEIARSSVSSIVSKATNLQRCWEEIHNFPKFKGANPTHEFQHFSFGEQIYLIPPLCQFYNYNISEMNEILEDLKTYDLIVLDPPWRNKYIKRLKRHKQELAYQMLDNEELQRLPISRLIHPENGLVAIWCTNSQQHQQALIEDFLPAWNLRLLHTLKWFKINTSYELNGNINNVGNKQPFEMLYIACHKESNCDFDQLKGVDQLLSIPSIVHSHKPPLLKWLSEYLPENPQCLELFARYLQPHFTCIGMEVLKLMDQRLFKRTKL